MRSNKKHENKRKMTDTSGLSARSVIFWHHFLLIPCRCVTLSALPGCFPLFFCVISVPGVFQMYLAHLHSNPVKRGSLSLSLSFSHSLSRYLSLSLSPFLSLALALSLSLSRFLSFSFSLSLSLCLSLSLSPLSGSLRRLAFLDLHST